MLARVLLVALLIFTTQAFYLPGVAPVEFQENESVELKVNKLTSVHTQLPYKYYYLPFCQPESIVDKIENLGEILRGDRIENSLYEIKAGVSETCKVLCTQEYSADKIKLFSEMVGYEYRVHWIVDNLPAATPKTVIEPNGESVTIYEDGFALGIKGGSDGAIGTETGKNYINNHVNIKLYYHLSDAYEGKRIVGFEVEPRSIDYKGWTPSGDSTKPNCNGDFSPLVLDESSSKLPVTWTYSVTWEEDRETEWSNRWDKYLLNTDPQIHWFSIINSLMIVLFLTGMVAMIMMRTLNADFRRYNAQYEANDEAEETGWKLVHANVFRPPTRPMLLSVLVGSGVQVFAMTLITMVFAMLGFLSPANRGGLTTAGVVLFVIMGMLAGYFSTRNYKMLKGSHWKKNALWTAIGFPGVAFGIFFVLDMIVLGQRSSGAVPVSWLFGLVALWFGISVPLCFLGAYFAFRKPVPENPVKTHQIARQIPEQVWYMRPVFSVMMGGILPFGAVFIELFFILTAIWGNQFYYIFGFLFIVFVILILTCAEIAIVMCYFQLCSEDYHWWWRAFLTSGSSAVYMFLYSVFYFFTKLEIERFVSALLFFGYTLIMTLAFFVLTGSIGYFASLVFVRKIYSQVKVD